MIDESILTKMNEADVVKAIRERLLQLKTNPLTRESRGEMMREIQQLRQRVRNA